MLESEEKRLMAASCYMAHDRPAPPQELRSLVTEAGSKNLQLLIGADANAHHNVWGSPDINDRGESLLDFILSTNLDVANVGEEHTFVGPTSGPTGKITLVSDWRVLERPSFSDHKYIQFKREFEHSVRTITVYRNLRNTNWIKFQKTVTSKLANLGSVKSEEDIDKSIETLSKGLLDAYQSA
ncbi:uncharacterized protein LOC117186416 isoform X1 [Drosophila miranda]|uniref:uncharacterized protein LOC117186416 isoform X1 n=1 Tax=Drosophila miranda TaxID=7229 RepID=UPI00143F27D5|nr:uncharacterized protein LOC117186416 isoform X1 [Drosophila miranda]XP_033243077.1 uncharacterized protein LOC117186416 isoform X1 [Drosophila miranda]